MRTLLIIGKPDKHGDFGQLLICPKCKSYDDLGFDSEEYIGANCLYMCCARYLICPTGDIYDTRGKGDICSLQKGITTGCTVALTKEQAEAYMRTNGININKNYECDNTDIDPNNCYYYLVSLLNLTRVGRFYNPDKLNAKNESNDWTAEYLLKQQDSHNFKFSDTEYVVYKTVDNVNIDSIDNVKTSHDGIYLYYYGKCTECDKCYESFITGD
ncbi:Hypothetical protein PACV_70 [Pacmanvirus A23]|uniref:Hypothetical protein n=1 Tax=Pacmanvirus A23 TaxID=1932881 RepID=UPI000A092EF5|nr:Hypothetical protein B9W72_gp070 [Pacmanvirus A23]SIP85787.1 Hypothetical protein PACV_70 [Pacmanvirus A23]